MERFLLNNEEGQYQNQEIDQYAIKLLAFGSPIRAIAPPFLKGEQKNTLNRFLSQHYGLLLPLQTNSILNFNAYSHLQLYTYNVVILM